MASHLHVSLCLGKETYDITVFLNRVGRVGGSSSRFTVG